MAAIVIDDMYGVADQAKRSSALDAEPKAAVKLASSKSALSESDQRRKRAPSAKSRSPGLAAASATTDQARPTAGADRRYDRPSGTNLRQGKFNQRGERGLRRASPRGVERVNDKDTRRVAGPSRQHLKKIVL
jgi:hypothetical protein